MSKEIDYEALSKRLHDALKVAKKFGLEIVPGGGFSADHGFTKLPAHEVGLFGALSIVEGSSARSKLGLTYQQTLALEDGFNSADEDGYVAPKKIKKDEVYLKLEAIGRELGKKMVPDRPKPKFKSKKKLSYSSFAAPPVWRNVDLGAMAVSTNPPAPQPIFQMLGEEPLAAGTTTTVRASDLLPTYDAYAPWRAAAPMSAEEVAEALPLEAQQDALRVDPAGFTSAAGIDDLRAATRTYTRWMMEEPATEESTATAITPSPNEGFGLHWNAEEDAEVDAYDDE